MFNKKDIKEYLVSDKYDFKMFKLNYSDKEKKAIKKLDINSSHIKSIYGTIEDMKRLGDFLQTFGDNDSKTLKQIEKTIIRLTKSVIKSFKTEYFWLLIKGTTPHHGFDIPRWHVDGTHLSSIVYPQPKFGTVLKGPGTLLVKGTPENRAIYEKIHQAILKEDYPNIPFKDMTKEHHEKVQQIENKYRKIYAKAFDKKYTQVKKNHGVIFFGGKNPNTSAIHSEPKIDTTRLFISIVPYTKDQIEMLKEKYGNTL